MKRSQLFDKRSKLLKLFLVGEPIYGIVHLNMVLGDQSIVNVLQKSSEVTLEVASKEICVCKFYRETIVVATEEQVELIEFLLCIFSVKKIWL